MVNNILNFSPIESDNESIMTLPRGLYFNSYKSPPSPNDIPFSSTSLHPLHSSPKRLSLFSYPLSPSHPLNRLLCHLRSSVGIFYGPTCLLLRLNSVRRLLFRPSLPQPETAGNGNIPRTTPNTFNKPPDDSPTPTQPYEHAELLKINYPLIYIPFATIGTTTQSTHTPVAQLQRRPYFRDSVLG